jgi:Flp pilus assembly protein TadG
MWSPRRSASADPAGRRRRATRGSVAVEFALVAPAFAAMVIAVIHLGLAFHAGSSVRWAVERAARAAMLDPAMDETAVQARVDAELAALGGGFAIDVAYAVDGDGTVPVGRITGEYVHRVTAPFLPPIEMAFDVDVRTPRY